MASDAGSPQPGNASDMPRELSVDDLDDDQLDTMADTIVSVVARETDVRVKRVYVMGSFARGEARRVASDIDIRVVVCPCPATAVQEEIKDLLKCEYGPTITPEAAGYLDAHVTNVEPTNEPHVEVFSYDE